MCLEFRKFYNSLEAKLDDERRNKQGEEDPKWGSFLR